MANQKDPDQKQEKVMRSSVDHGKGVIRDNAVHAMLHSKMFRHKVEQKQTGRGSYTRKAKHKGREY